MCLEKRKAVTKVSVTSQFRYCPLACMFHGRGRNNEINSLQERALMVKCDIKSYELIYVAHVPSCVSRVLPAWCISCILRALNVFVPYISLCLTCLTRPVPALHAPCVLYLNFHFSRSYFWIWLFCFHSTFVLFHKSQFCLYIGKFWYT